MRDILQMRDGWRFHEGDVREMVEHGYMYTYMHTKTERGRVPTACSGGNHGDVCVDLGRAPAGVGPLEAWSPMTL